MTFNRKNKWVAAALLSLVAAGPFGCAMDGRAPAERAEGAPEQAASTSQGRDPPGQRAAKSKEPDLPKQTQEALRTSLRALVEERREPEAQTPEGEAERAEQPATGGAGTDAEAEAPQPKVDLKVRLPALSDDARAEVEAFYAARDGEPAWVATAKQRAKAQAMLSAACEAATEGLDATAWKLDDAKAQLERVSGEAGLKLSADEALESELALTATLLNFARDVRYGQVDPGEVRWRIEPDAAKAASLLNDAVEAKDPLASMRPSHPQYAALLEAKAALEAVAARGGWPKLDEGPMLSEGDEDPRVVQLRQRLAASGEWSGDMQSPVFDAALAQAVQRFQANRGLETDGVVGGNTLKTLREPIDKQLQRLRVNLERLRWMPEEIGGRHVVVNVPGFELEAKDGDRTVLRSPVVVGVYDWQTPVMSSNVVRLEVNPEWRVPPRMSREEIFPLVQEKPEWARRRGMKVIERATGQEVDPLSVDWQSAEPGAYRFVQRAGPNNPMGEVKLAMDNRFSVYLHGTPDPEAFEKSRRALSHGCVRVKELDALSRFVLPKSDHAAYDEAQETGAETWLELEEPVPVYFVYVTAWVAEDGTLQQRPDVYGRDRRLARVLGEPDDEELACR